MKDCVPWGGPQGRLGEQREEEGAAETSCYGLTTIPTRHLDLQSIGGNKETAVKACPHLWKTSVTQTAMSLSIFVLPVCEFMADQWAWQYTCNRQLSQGFPRRSLNLGKSIFKCSFQNLCPERLRV